MESWFASLMNEDLYPGPPIKTRAEARVPPVRLHLGLQPPPAAFRARIPQTPRLRHAEHLIVRGTGASSDCTTSASVEPTPEPTSLMLLQDHPHPRHPR